MNTDRKSYFKKTNILKITKAIIFSTRLHKWIIPIICGLYISSWSVLLLNHFWFNFQIPLFSFQDTAEDTLTKVFSDNDLELVASFISAILAISLPISLGVVSNLDSKYNSSLLTKDFFKEPIVKGLITLLFTNVFSVLINTGFGHLENQFIHYFTWIIAITAFFSFLTFILLLMEYYTSLKNYIFDKSNQNLSYQIEHNQFEEIILNIEKISSIALTELKTDSRKDLIDTISFVDSIAEEIMAIEDKDKLKKINDFKFENTGIQIKSKSNVFNQNDKSFWQTILDTYYELWVKAYEKEYTDITRKIANSFIQNFKNAFKVDEPFPIVYDILFKMVQIVKKGTHLRPVNYDYTIQNFTYVWFEVYYHLIRDKAIQQTDEQHDQVERYLWENLKNVILSRDNQTIKAFISSAFSGPIWYNQLEGNIQIDYQDQQRYKRFQELIDLGYQIKHLSDLPQWQCKFDQLRNSFESSIGSINFKNHEIEFERLNQSAIGKALYEKQKNFIHHTAAFALHSKNYTYITQLWSYLQPNDSSSINSGNKLLPERLSEVFEVYFSARTDSFIHYNLEGFHDISVYVRRYATLLFIRQYTLRQLDGYQNFLGHDDIIFSVEYSDIDNWIYRLENFKGILLWVLTKTKLCNELGLPTDFGGSKAPLTIIDNIIKDLTNKKEHLEEQANLDLKKIQNFKHRVSGQIEKDNIFKHLIDKHGEIRYVPHNEKLQKFMTVPNITLKGPLSENNYIDVIGYGDNITGELLFHINRSYVNLFQALCEKLDKVFQTSSIDLLDKIEQACKKDNQYIIVGFNHRLEISAFSNNKNFIPVSQINSDEVYPEKFSGLYKENEVYTFFDRATPPYIVILNKNNLGILELYHASESDTPSNQVHTSILDLNDPKNHSTLERLIKQPPRGMHSHKGLEQELRKTVRIQLEYYLKYTIDEESFDGAIIYVND